MAKRHHSKAVYWTTLNTWEHLAENAVGAFMVESGSIPGIQDGEVEVFNARGRHLGALDPMTGALIIRGGAWEKN